jgi:hypothetical protein
MIKAKRVELKRIDDKKKRDCITINIVRFKSGIEDIFKKLDDELVDSMQSSIEKDVEEVETFVKSAQEKLSSNTKNLEEIEAMHKNAIQIEASK